MTLPRQQPLQFRHSNATVALRPEPSAMSSVGLYRTLLITTDFHRAPLKWNLRSKDGDRSRRNTAGCQVQSNLDSRNGLRNWIRVSGIETHRLYVERKFRRQTTYRFSRCDCYQDSNIEHKVNTGTRSWYGQTIVRHGEQTGHATQNICGGRKDSMRNDR